MTEGPIMRSTPPPPEILAGELVRTERELRVVTSAMISFMFERNQLRDEFDRARTEWLETSQEHAREFGEMVAERDTAQTEALKLQAHVEALEDFLERVIADAGEHLLPSTRAIGENLGILKSEGAEASPA